MKTAMQLVLMAVCVIFALAGVGLQVAAQSGSSNTSNSSAMSEGSNDSPALDYEFFKSRVEPIFLEKRVNHARCYVCHENAAHALKLQSLLPGAKTWTEEQSQKNFKVVSQLVTPGDPMSSILLTHPLAPEAGGDSFHSGGRQFQSQNDPDWQTLAEWVKGAKAN